MYLTTKHRTEAEFKNRCGTSWAGGFLEQSDGDDYKQKEQWSQKQTGL